MSRRWQMAGVRMPIESLCLQALVSEPIKPVIDCVVMANTVHGYVSQSDKGELVIGGGTDPYNNYSQRGSFPSLEHTVTALVETFPIISRLRMLRQWGGIVDMTGDRSPIISKTPMSMASMSIAAGAPAASRPFRVRAMSSPTPSPTTGPTRSPNLSA